MPKRTAKAQPTTRQTDVGPEAAAPPTTARATTKLAILLALLKRPEGATLADLTQATGWQAHSVRGALAGALKKAGLTITSSKEEGVRTYRAEGAA